MELKGQEMWLMVLSRPKKDNGSKAILTCSLASIVR